MNVPKYIENQDRYKWRRRILRDLLLRGIGFTLLVKPTVTGLAQFPQTGGTLLIMNHIGFPDPFVVVGAVTSRFVIPMSKVENFRHPFVGLIARGWGAYPVDRDKIDRRALEITLGLLKAGQCVLIAPEGTRQPELAEPKEGFTYVATKTNTAIVPVGLEFTDRVGKNMKRLRRTPIDIRFGPAFRFKTEGRSRIPRDEMAKMTTEAMYQLAKLVNEERRGPYHDLSKATTETLEFLK